MIHQYSSWMRLFKNISFGKATLDLVEKAGLRLLFPKPLPKLTEFWKRLEYPSFCYYRNYYQVPTICSLYTSADIYESPFKLIEPELDRKLSLTMERGLKVIVSRQYSGLVKEKLERSISWLKNETEHRHAVLFVPKGLIRKRALRVPRPTLGYDFRAGYVDFGSYSMPKLSFSTTL